jgi:hypothetical protein
MVLAIVLAIFGLRNAWTQAQRSFGFDFYQFWLVGQEIRTNRGVNVYTDEFRAQAGERYYQIGQSPAATDKQATASGHRRLIETFSTPLLYTLFSLIGTSNYEHSLLAFQIIELISGTAAIVIIGRVLSRSWTWCIFATALLCGWGLAYLTDMLVGNVNQIETLLVALLIWVECRMKLPARDYLGGALIAFMTAFKPNLVMIPALLGLVWMVERRWRVLGRHATAGLVAGFVLIALSSAYFGSMRAWLDWIGAFRELVGRDYTVEQSNYSLVRYVREAIGPAAGSIVGNGVFLASLAGVVWLGWKAVSERTIVVISLACALPLLTSPISWLHYFALATPLLLLAAAQNRLAVVLAGLAFFAMSSSSLTSVMLRMDDPHGTAQRMIAATVALCAWGIYQLKTPTLNSTTQQ